MENRVVIIKIVTIVIVSAAVAYFLYLYKHTVTNIRAENTSLTSELATTKTQLKNLESRTVTLEKRFELLAGVLTEVQNKGISIASKVDQVTSTVNTLDKLSKTDSELLKQYSKVYFLNEHYVPESLMNIDAKYVYTPGKVLSIHSNVAPYLYNLEDAAKAAGLTLRLDSAFRSFGAQAQLKSSYKITYGAGTANAFSAEQGYSEHQLGTTVDFTADSLGGGLAGFSHTPEYQWLLSNAYLYGFVISYPEGNTSYQFEPWHWRFVGKDLALYLHQNNMYFYNMDQRKIDTYLANIFE